MEKGNNNCLDFKGRLYGNQPTNWTNETDEFLFDICYFCRGSVESVGSITLAGIPNTGNTVICYAT